MQQIDLIINIQSYIRSNKYVLLSMSCIIFKLTELKLGKRISWHFPYLHSFTTLSSLCNNTLYSFYSTFNINLLVYQILENILYAMEFPTEFTFFFTFRIQSYNSLKARSTLLSEIAEFSQTNRNRNWLLTN